MLPTTAMAACDITNNCKEIQLLDSKFYNAKLDKGFKIRVLDNDLHIRIIILLYLKTSEILKLS